MSIDDEAHLPVARPAASIEPLAANRLAGRTAELLGIDQPKKLWERPAENGLNDLDSCGDGIAVVSNAVIDLATGTTLWTLPEENEHDSFESDLYDHDFEAWRWLAGCALRTRLWNDQLVVRTATGGGLTIGGHEPRTGQTMWRVESTQLPYRDWMVWFSRYDSALHNAGTYWADLDPPRDRRLWTIPCHSESPVVPLTDAGRAAGVVLGVEEESGSVVGIDPAAGTIVWTAESPHRLGDTYVGADDRYVVVGEWKRSEPEVTCTCHPDCGDDSPASRCAEECKSPFDTISLSCQYGTTPNPDRPTWCAVCDLPFGQATCVKVLDRETGTVLWEHEWQGRDQGVRTYPHAYEVALPLFQGPRALAGNTVITWEAYGFHGRALADGTLLWSSSIVFAAIDATYVDAVPRHQKWTSWTVFSNEECLRPDLLVNAVTGRVLQLPGTRRNGESDCGFNLRVVDDFLFAVHDGLVTCYRLPPG